MEWSVIVFILETRLGLQWGRTIRCIHVRQKSDDLSQLITVHDCLILQNIVKVIMICVPLNMDKPQGCSVETDDEHPWPYHSTMFEYAKVHKDFSLPS